jgi:hypothetical protein
MKMKLTVLVLSLCLNFFAVLNVFAETSPDQILQKQKEIDTYIFEQHAGELAEKGISVTHTAPLENKVEIGVLPYNEETISYFHGIFGEENITIVDGQMAVTMVTTTDPKDMTNNDAPVPNKEEEEEKALLQNPIMIATAGIALLAGAILIIQKKRRV